MFGTTPFPRPYLSLPTPYFSPESRYRCATKQRDEGSWTKTRHGLALVGANQSMRSRFSEDCRHPHDCAKESVDAGWPRWVRAWQNLTRRFSLLLLRPLRFNAFALPYSLMYVCTYLTYTHRHAPSLTSVLFLGATAGKPRGKSPGGN